MIREVILSRKMGNRVERSATKKKPKLIRFHRLKARERIKKNNEEGKGWGEGEAEK